MRTVGFLLLVAVSAAVSLVWLSLSVGDPVAFDWRNYTRAGQRVWSGGLYDVNSLYAFPYSPLMAYLFGPISLLGVTLWRTLHVVAALALPTWRMRLVVLTAWPFWFDVQLGNLLVFVLLAAAWALRGNRVAALVFLSLTLLVPRPLMIPVAAWLLWRQPWLRLPCLGLVILSSVLVALSGWGPDWLGYLLHEAPREVAAGWNIGPSRLVGGPLWLAAGVPLAAWLTYRGRLGWASLAVSPYLLPYYLLMGALELTPAHSRTGSSP